MTKTPAIHHPRLFAASHPNKPAWIMASTGESITFRQLEDRANQCAHLLRRLGIGVGDSIALFMNNDPAFLEICWGAQRAGVYYTCISSRLTAGEMAYIVKDCEAKVLFVSEALRTIADEADTPNITARFVVGGDDTAPPTALPTAPPTALPYTEALTQEPTTPIADETAGLDMLYSSGTTGRPKGIRRPLPNVPPEEAETAIIGLCSALYGITDASVYLSPAPLYHAAPLRFVMSAQRLGATCVIMETFDPALALASVEQYKVSHSQWTPSMFVRMLKAPEALRSQYNLATHQCAIHAAAPCPVQVKHAMMEWWGPILHEYYAGTEGNGICVIGPEEWLAHPGSVGRPLNAILRICREDGDLADPGEEGVIYFESANQFSYYKDEAKTKESRHPKHDDWSTLGDIGKVDEEGFLYLTDRRAFMIISGGVNVYPQEVENTLIMHPRVSDVAVIGAPDEDFGEAVVAVVEPMDPKDAGEALSEELLAFCRERLSKIKTPKRVDFIDALPRHPTGKLYKRLIRDKYWGKRDSRIV